ncbi:porin family protein [Runella sp.]|uniref:porin family protein n=1 Tax=Runella sp. TaxID=1960881 RepID=UPI003D1410BC
MKKLIVKKMEKRILTVLVIMTVFAGSICAQGGLIDNRKKIQVGVKAGMNYSNVYDTKGEEFKSSAKAGFAGGLFLSIPIGAFIGIQPEMLLSQKGFHATGRILGSAYDFTRTTTYIDVPLFLAIKPAGFLTLLVGPQFSYLLKQKNVFENGITTVQQESEFENDNIRKNTLCFIGGVDINLNHFIIGARAGWDSMNNNGDGTATTPRYKNTWLQGTIGIRF